MQNLTDSEMLKIFLELDIEFVKKDGKVVFTKKNSNEKFTITQEQLQDLSVMGLDITDYILYEIPHYLNITQEKVKRAFEKVFKKTSDLEDFYDIHIDI
jgi:hypothetical protein